MAYTLDFNFHLIVPNIAVGDGNSGPLEEMDVSLASASHGEYICTRRCTLKRLYFLVSGLAIVGTPSVVFKKRPTPLSAVGESTVGTLLLAAGTQPGEVIWKSVSPVEFDAGDSVEISWIQGTAGQGHARMQLEPHTESPANQANMVEDLS